jgi:ATP-dependent DNA helicase RecG
MTYEYPLIATREAVINAVLQWDYFNDSFCIFIHIFSNRLEIENPGGLPGGLTLEELGERSVRRVQVIKLYDFRPNDCPENNLCRNSCIVLIF